VAFDSDPRVRRLVAIATITWARSPEEDRRLRHSLTRLLATGVPIAVADTGLTPSFARFLRRHSGFTVTQERGGLVAQIEASFRIARAFGSRFVLYTEPDKALFFEHVAAFLEQAIRNGGLTIAARSRRSFKTYPASQRYAEQVINHLCGEALGREGDYSYGPFLFPRSLIRHVLPLPSDIGWGWRHYAFRQAHRRGLAIRHIARDYPCPMDQRVDDEAERVHRLRQLSQNIQGLLA
jgi:hypothetical protein